MIQKAFSRRDNSRKSFFLPIVIISKTLETVIKHKSNFGPKMNKIQNYQKSNFSHILKWPSKTGYFELDTIPGSEIRK